MEKKTKKLQLRKETIAVLNGEKMAHIVGGGSGFTEHPPCGPNAVWILIDPINEKGECKCKETYVGNPYIGCFPEQGQPSDNLCTIRTNRGCTNC